MRTKPRIQHAIHRVRAVWNELDYAQQRLFEIRTGVNVIEDSRRPAMGRREDEPEALYTSE